MLFAISTDSEGRAILDDDLHGDVICVIEAQSWIEAREQALMHDEMDMYDYRDGWGVDDEGSEQHRNDMKLTAKQESFCLAYLETGNASEAYRMAYSAEKMKPATVSRNAKALMDNNKIATRLDELRKPVIEAAQITLESHLKRLAELSEAAEGEGQFSAAITAEIARGKAAGIHIEKSEQTITTRELPASVDEFV